VLLVSKTTTVKNSGQWKTAKNRDPALHKSGLIALTDVILRWTPSPPFCHHQ
jgi:hypothetical protein